MMGASGQQLPEFMDGLGSESSDESEEAQPLKAFEEPFNAVKGFFLMP